METGKYSVGREEIGIIIRLLVEEDLDKVVGNLILFVVQGPMGIQPRVDLKRRKKRETFRQNRMVYKQVWVEIQAIWL